MKNLKMTVGIVLVLLILFWINYSKANSPEEIKKFSTISEIFLDDNMARVNLIIAAGATYKNEMPKSKGMYNDHEVFQLEDRKVNNLEGDVFLYVKNNKVKKIEFISSGEWLGSTSAAGFMFDEFYNEREAWIEDAMSYYGIPRWRENENFMYYEKHGIVHQYKLEKVEAFNVQLGWNLTYIISSEDAIESELQIEKDNLKF